MKPRDRRYDSDIYQNMKKWTDEQLIQAVKLSTSIANVLRLLGLIAMGSNYLTIKNSIKNLNIDTSHFLGKASSKGKKKTLVYKTATNDLLVKDSYVGTSVIKRRVIKENLLNYLCSECGLYDWNSKPLVLHMDHINGVNNDHRIENLRFLCPNCHSQTQTYCGRNSKRKKPPKTTNYICLDCNTAILSATDRCRSCSAKQQKTKIEWLDTDTLIHLVNEFGYMEIGRRLGVSGNAVKKRIINHPSCGTPDVCVSQGERTRVNV